MNMRTIIAADGLPRRAFTVAEVESMVVAGVIDEDERIELVDGELIPMSPKGNRHELLKTEILAGWVPRCPPDRRLAVETTLRLSTDTFLEPDILVFPRGVGFRNLSGPASDLAVEVSATTLGYDLGRKAGLYAAYGLPELWVVDAVRLEIHVHRGGTSEGWRSVTVHAATESLVPQRVPALSLRLADLDLAELADLPPDEG